MVRIPKSIQFCIKVFDRQYDVRLFNPTIHCVIKTPGHLLLWLLKGRHFGEIVSVVNNKRYLYHYFPKELIREYADFMGKDYNTIITQRYKRERGLKQSHKSTNPLGW